MDRKKKFRVVIASSTFENQGDALQVLKDSGCCETIIIPESKRKGWTDGDLIQQVKGIDGLIMGGEHLLTANVIKAADQLKVVSLNCTGYDHIDLEELTKRGIALCNTPGLSYNAVADFIWGQILASMRQIVRGDRLIRSGKWVKGVEKSASVSGKTIGIVGMGSIGKAVARRAIGFDMNILATVRTPRKEVEDQYGLTFVPKEELIKNSDIIVICCPLSKETHHYIGESEFHLMKSGSFIINTSRGPIIDEDALYKVLKEGCIAGAALDVFSVEPLFESKFFDLDNVVLTPHMGGLADQQINDCAVLAAKNLVTYLQGKPTKYQVNSVTVTG